MILQFMAYYDYDPVKQGPYSRGFKKTCNDELALKTGDFVVVHGDPKANGFYLAEVSDSCEMTSQELCFFVMWPV